VFLFRGGPRCKIKKLNCEFSVLGAPLRSHREGKHSRRLHNTMAAVSKTTGFFVTPSSRPAGLFILTFEMAAIAFHILAACLRQPKTQNVVEPFHFTSGAVIKGPLLTQPPKQNCLSRQAPQHRGPFNM